MRNIVMVIDDILQYVEDEETEKSLTRISNKFYFTAPEAMFLLWDELADVINVRYNVPLKNENEIKIVSIFTTLPIEKVKKQFS